MSNAGRVQRRATVTWSMRQAPARTHPRCRKPARAPAAAKLPATNASPEAATSSSSSSSSSPSLPTSASRWLTRHETHQSSSYCTSGSDLLVRMSDEAHFLHAGCRSAASRSGFQSCRPSGAAISRQPAGSPLHGMVSFLFWVSMVAQKPIC